MTADEEVSHMERSQVNSTSLSAWGPFLKEKVIEGGPKHGHPPRMTKSCWMNPNFHEKAAGHHQVAKFIES